METIYLISLLAGGFFVVLSILGGGDSEAAMDAEFDVASDTDFDLSLKQDFTPSQPGAGPGLVDLLSVRALFLFAAFFGLTGMLLSWIDSGEPFTGVISLLTGLVVGLGGNYFIKRVGDQHISSSISGDDLQGRTGRVLIPFEGTQRGKVSLVANGHRLQVLARAFADDPSESFLPGDEVVVVRMNGSVAEVLKPD